MKRAKKKTTQAIKGKQGFQKRVEEELSNKQVTTYLTPTEHRRLKEAIKGKYTITEFLRLAIEEKLSNESI